MSTILKRLGRTGIQKAGPAPLPFNGEASNNGILGTER